MCFFAKDSQQCYKPMEVSDLSIKLLYLARESLACQIPWMSLIFAPSIDFCPIKSSISNTCFNQQHKQGRQKEKKKLSSKNIPKDFVSSAIKYSAIMCLQNSTIPANMKPASSTTDIPMKAGLCQSYTYNQLLHSKDLHPQQIVIIQK